MCIGNVTSDTTVRRRQPRGSADVPPALCPPKVIAILQGESSAWETAGGTPALPSDQPFLITPITNPLAIETPTAADGITDQSRLTIKPLVPIFSSS